MSQHSKRIAPLEALPTGMPVLFGGDRMTFVSPALADAFRPGDRLVVVQDTGDLLHVPAAVGDAVEQATGAASRAFTALSGVSDAAITAFFENFACRLEDDAVWSRFAAANAEDVEAARARGRSTTRLAVSEAMRRDMIAGLRVWRDSPAGRGRLLEQISHPGWSVELVSAPLGVVGFVFEGRPNVFADAAGVLRTGNAVVFRIGSDALGCARVLMAEAVDPALAAAGLPPGAMSLVDSAERSAGWALFADRRLALAVARGSGPAVAQLGAIARQTGVPVSLHGTGGAWMIADASADAARFGAVVYHSLDRKVCNTLNVCTIVRSRATELIPVFLQALEAAGRRRRGYRLHVLQGAEVFLPGPAWMAETVEVVRPEGVVAEPRADLITEADLAREWEWEETPEVSLAIVEDLEAAIALFNRRAPRLVATVITGDPDALARFEAGVEAPFIGDGFTRWVDGQYALQRPELGLSNWEGGRLFARGGVLAGDGVFTVRTRMRQADAGLDRSAIGSPPGFPKVSPTPDMWAAGQVRRRSAGGRPGALKPGFTLFGGMKVGLYGGSFNPAHEGHAHVAETARKRLGLDRVIWLVSPQNPLKSGDQTLPLTQRLEGVRRFARDRGMIVSDIEARLGTRYTLDTILALKARFPGVHFVWIMGADSLAGFHRWRGWTQILHALPVAVVSRPWISLKSRASPAARRFAGSRQPVQGARRLPGLAPPAWIFLHGPLNFQSSTALRERLQAGRTRQG